MASIAKRPDGRYRARYRDKATGKEHARHFRRKTDAQDWLDDVTAKRVSPDKSIARMSVGDWCDRWLDGYSTRRPSTVRQARTHIAKIRDEFGAMPLSAVRPSQVKAWTARLRGEGYEASYVYALHARLGQLFSDAVHDGIVPRSPCSRRTSPGAGSQRPYVATTEQVWALHDAMPAPLRPAVLLAAFAGLRLAETCGLRVADVDFMRGIVSPALQYPAQELKSDTSRTPVPIPRSMTLELAAHVQASGATGPGSLLGASPWAVERAMRSVRGKVAGLPEGFRYHDLRHYFASLLIASGADVKTVQARLRHASAKTTLDTYGHLWPDRDESTRAAVEQVFRDRADFLRTDGAAP
jgi:integrase